jgi:hypothetical protein
MRCGRGVVATVGVVDEYVEALAVADAEQGKVPSRSLKDGLLGPGWPLTLSVRRISVVRASADASPDFSYLTRPRLVR